MCDWDVFAAAMGCGGEEIWVGEVPRVLLLRGVQLDASVDEKYRIEKF